jgi:hypothetical protein
MLVITPTGNVREAPTLQSKVLAILPRGSEVTMIGNGGGWAHVTVAGREGYMDLVQLRKAPRESTSEWTARYKEMQVALESATVNLKPTTDSRILLTLPRGSQVMVIATSKGWAHVQGYDFDGYINLDWLSEEPAPYMAESNAVPASKETRMPNSQFHTTAPSRHTAGFYEPLLRQVGAHGATIYERPDSQSRKRGFLQPGRQVSLIGSSGDWSHVIGEGTDGFMRTNEFR